MVSGILEQFWADFLEISLPKNCAKNFPEKMNHTHIVEFTEPLSDYASLPTRIEDICQPKHAMLPRID